MERMQQHPSVTPTGRRGVSPASHSANSKPSILTRRRDSSLPREDRRISTAKRYTLPPLKLHSQPQPVSNFADDNPWKPAKQPQPRSSSTEPKTAPATETKRFDRDTLPSMTKASHQSSPIMKMVTFLPSEDGDESDHSSICHSPTWDDYGKKKRKEKLAEQRRKRLSKKEPPPAAMDNRPELHPRTLSDTILDNHNIRQSSESFQSRSSQPHATTITTAATSTAAAAASQTDIPPVPPLPQTNGAEPIDRTSAFIGGVRLEREREAALKRLVSSRASSMERPVSEVTPQTPKTPALKKRETTPPSVRYPPTASKTPFLSQPPSAKGHTRNRAGSLGSGLISSAAKLFTPREKEPKVDDLVLQRNRSRDSIQSIQSLFSSALDRGRQMNSTPSKPGRAQSNEGTHRHTPSAASHREEKKGGISLPPLSWKNKRRDRTTSMMAAPPDSARDASFLSDDNGPKLKQDNFSFLEQPFSPGTTAPLSPPGSLSASLKAKMSPQLTPTSRPLSQAPKKTLRETIKAGFRSSLALERPGHQRSATDSAIITQFPMPVNRQTLPSSPLAGPSANGSPASSSRGVRPNIEHAVSSPISQIQSATDPKDSGASSSSSHPDSESQPQSPITSPETSRPQSAKDETFRVEDLKKALQASAQGTNGKASVRPVTSILAGQTSNYFSSNINAEKAKGSPKDVAKQAKGRGSNFIEELSGSQPFLTDEVWSLDKKPLDSDQLSFTSALTSLDVKRSFQDFNNALDSPNADIEPFYLDKYHRGAVKETKVTLRQVQVEVTHGQAGSKQSRGLDTSSSGYPPYRPVRTNGRQSRASVSGIDTDPRSFSARTRTESPDSFLPTSTKASAYLQEARRAAPSPSSPRAPVSNKASGNASLPSPASPRSFTLSTPKGPMASAVTVPSPLSHSSSPAGDNLDKPIAKMFVECCNCMFYQDMPSRVYEAMVQPDDVVKDKRLGVSGQVTTCVKCPWCSHNMSTTCCAGYAAVVYLREKLHGP